MFQLTRFESLLVEVRKLGADKLIKEIARDLETGLLDANPEDIVYGENGLYYVDQRGVLARVIVHIVDKRIDSRYFPDVARKAIDNDNFDDDLVVKKSHKFHVLNCTTLQTAERDGWRDKYKMTQNRDGTFYYRFITKEKVYKENRHQKLLVCSNCLRELNKKYKGQDSFLVDNFSMDKFFSAEYMQHWQKPEDYTLDVESVPNIYQKDWSEISRKFKEKKNYQCEGENCRYRDLSKPELRQYLHCHHRNMDKSNNNFSNLMALCIACHAEQPNHEHMKGAEYKSYIKLVDNLLRKSA